MLNKVVENTSLSEKFLTHSWTSVSPTNCVEKATAICKCRATSSLNIFNMQKPLSLWMRETKYLIGGVQ